MCPKHNVELQVVCDEGRCPKCFLEWLMTAPPAKPMKAMKPWKPKHGPVTKGA